MKIELTGNGNIKHLINMLAWIELLGNIGHSTEFTVLVDGDGNSRWGFEFENDKLQEQYDELKKELLKEYQTTDTDIPQFNL